MEPPDASRRIIPCALASEESGRSGENSSQPAVAFHADQARHVELARPYGFLAAQVPGEQIPYRLAACALGDGRPACDLVGLARLDRTLADAHVAYAIAPACAGSAAVAHAADPHHVAALLIIRIRIEQVVADVLQVRLDRFAGHFSHDDVRIGDR